MERNTVHSFNDHHDYWITEHQHAIHVDLNIGSSPIGAPRLRAEAMQISFNFRPAEQTFDTLGIGHSPSSCVTGKLGYASVTLPTNFLDCHLDTSHKAIQGMRIVN